MKEALDRQKDKTNSPKEWDISDSNDSEPITKRNSKYT